MIVITIFTLISIISFAKGGNDCKLTGWEVEPQCGKIPPISSASTFVSSNNDLYLILGFNECFNISACDNVFYSLDQIYKFDTKANEWELINVTGPNVPAPRVFAGIDITQDDGDIIVYGGVIYDNFFSFPFSGLYDDFWKYSITDNQWTQLPVLNTNDSNVPPGLSLPGLLANEDFVYVFGGFKFGQFGFEATDTLYRYSFDTQLWEIISPSGPVPSPRGVFSVQWSQQNNDKFYLFGGESEAGSVLFFDLWEYDITNNEWTPLNETEIVPEAGNYGAFIVTKKDELYMALGETNDDLTVCISASVLNARTSISTKTYKFDDENGWEELEFNTFSPSLKRIAYVYNRKRKNIYIYGGFDIKCSNGGPGIDIYNQQMYILDV